MYPRKENIKGTFKNQKNEVDVNLSLISFEEDGSFIIYCPALDVSGYGYTEEEARESFTTSLASFFQYTMNKKTFVQELTRLGWRVKNLHKIMSPPEMTHLLSENENFSRIFNNHPFRKYDTKIQIPLECVS